MRLHESIDELRGKLGSHVIKASAHARHTFCPGVGWFGYPGDKFQDRTGLVQYFRFCINMTDMRHRQYADHGILQLRLAAAAGLGNALRRVHSQDQLFACRIASMRNIENELLFEAPPDMRRTFSILTC